MLQIQRTPVASFHPTHRFSFADALAQKSVALKKSAASPFETEEHVALVDGAASVQPVMVRGLPMTLGEMSALPDFFAAPNEIYTVDIAKLKNILAAMRRKDKVSEAEWGRLTDNRSIELKQSNAEHFAPGASGKGGNRESFEHFYRNGLQLARVNAEAGTLSTGWALHYLADAFSSGHLFNKNDVMARFKSNMSDGKTRDAFLNRLADEIWRSGAASPLRNYEIDGTLKNLFGFGWISGAIDDRDKLKKLLRGIYDAKPDTFANLVVATLHDRLNEDGVDVQNENGNVWKAYGDGSADKSPTSIELLQQATRLAVGQLQNVKDKKPFDSDIAKIWALVPHPSANGAAMIEREAKNFTDPANAALTAYITGRAQEFMPSVIAALVGQGHLRRRGGSRMDETALKSASP